MGDYTVKVGVDLGDGLAQLQKAESMMKKMESSAKNLKVGVDFDRSGLSQLKSLESLSKKNYKTKFSIDTSGVKTATRDFQMMKNLANEISQKKIKLAGLDQSKNSNQYGVVSTQIKKLESDYNSLMKTFSKNGTFNTNQIGQLNNIFGKAGDKIDETKAKLKDLDNVSKKASNSASLIMKGNTSSNRMLNWLKNNTKAVKQYGEAIEQVAAQAKSSGLNGDALGLSEANTKFREITSEAQLMGKTGNSIFSELGRGFKQIGQFVGIYAILHKGAQTVGQMVKEVTALDSSMTELRKVSSAPDVQITKYFDTATKSAKKYGATISDVINSTADWSRLGYGLKDASVLSDATTMLQKVGDNMTQESSSESLVSTLKGFQMNTKDVTHIVDAMNEVANTQPIDTAGIAEALKRSSSSMSAAGNTLDETIGLITAANSVVQDPESVGTAFKTISMRIRGSKTALESAGLEVEGMATSTAKLKDEMIALSGVNIMKDKNTFKSTYQILDELSDKWSSMTDIQQASVTELIAGRFCQYVQKCA